MHDLNTSDIEDICKKLMAEFQGVLSLEWDSRFESVLAKISTDKKDSVREVLERCLINLWDSTNIDKASDTIQAVIDQLGGLMSGQLLFTSDSEKDAFIFCAWWPWGDGKTISVRIAPVFKIQSDSEMAERTRIFKSWFGM